MTGTNSLRSETPFDTHTQKYNSTRSSLPTDTIEKEPLISLVNSPTTPTSSPEAKRHIFEKQDRTTSLMALQALTKKIAIYQEEYGNTKTHHSPKLYKPKSRRKR